MTEIDLLRAAAALASETWHAYCKVVDETRGRPTKLARARRELALREHDRAEARYQRLLSTSGLTAIPA